VLLVSAATVVLAGITAADATGCLRKDALWTLARARR